MADKFGWTDDVITRLRQLWRDGDSASVIAKKLGCSRNAVLGKVHRIDLPPRRTPILNPGDTSRFWTTERDAQLVQSAKTSTVRALMAEFGKTNVAIRSRLAYCKITAVPAPQSYRNGPPRHKQPRPQATVIRLPTERAREGGITCQWIEGEVRSGGYTFCGEATAHRIRDGVMWPTSWCGFHLERVFQPLPPDEAA